MVVLNRMEAEQEVATLQDRSGFQTEREYISVLLAQLDSHLVRVHDRLLKLEKAGERLCNLNYFLHFTATALRTVDAEMRLSRGGSMKKAPF